MAANPTPRRRPFEGQPAPTPFWRSTELQLFLRLAGLLVLLSIVGFYFWASQKGKDLPNHPAEYVEEAARQTPVTEAERVERERRRYSAFEGALADSKNGDDLLQETPGYYKLLQTISNYTPEEMTAKAVRPLSYAASMADPDGWRGEFVWARGVVAVLEAVKLDRSAYGIEVVYRGVLTDGDASRGILFDLPVHPGERPSIREDAYDVEGIFYRVASYDSKEGKRKEAPWLLVRSLRPVASANDGRHAFMATFGPWLLGGMALVVALVLTYSLRRGPRRRPTERRQPESIRAMFARRLSEEGPPPPPPQPGPPPTP